MSIIDTSTVEVSAQADGARAGNGTFGALWLLARRRMWRDRLLVLSSAAIVAMATLLALSGPALVARIIDDGAADAVAAAGAGGDLVLSFAVGNPYGDNEISIRGMPVKDFAGIGGTVVSNLPTRTQSVVKDYDAWLLSRQTRLLRSATPAAIAAAESEGTAVVETPRSGDLVQFGYADDAEVVLIDGRLPDPPVTVPELPGVEQPAPPIEVAISQEVADLLDLGIGYQTEVATPEGSSLVLSVVGIVAPADPEAEVWSHFPEFTEPATIERSTGSDLRRGTIMVSIDTLAGVSKELGSPFTGYVRVSVDPEAMTLALAGAVAGELGDLPLDARALLGEDVGINAKLTTDLEAALKQYPSRARAAVAQMSVVIAGVVSVAAVVIALMASLLLARRELDIALERARGASVTSVSLRLLVESLLVTLVGLALGITAASFATPGVALSSGLVTVVALVSALSSPVLGGLHARGTWTGRREAANRQDRAKVAKARGARRITLEVLTILVAAAAVLSLRGRGVLQTITAGIDPFLAAAPVLITLAIVVIVVRLYPAPMAVVQFFAKRTRGVTGVLTLAKSRERIPVLPLLALTLAISVGIGAGLLVATVEGGQERASWERVGADVRIDSEVTKDQAAHLEAKGLTVSRGLYKPEATLAFGSDYDTATLLAMDRHYPAILAMGGVADTSSLQAMYDAAAAMVPGDPIPAQASQEIIDVDVHPDSKVYVGRAYVRFDIIGVAEITPDGWSDGPPYLLMPAEQLMAEEFKEPVAFNIAFVSGEGAAEAVAAEPGVDQATVTTRESWLAAMHDSALVGGVARAIAIAVAVVGLLAAVALLVTVLRGVRERGRALSMLRTQGMGSGYGWWLALAELAPLTLAAVVGGLAGGFATMALLGSTLGLNLLSGGLTDPPVEVDWTFLAVVGAGIVVLLFLAVAAEVLAHRRNKLSEVLRWGESR